MARNVFLQPSRLTFEAERVARIQVKHNCSRFRRWGSQDYLQSCETVSINFFFLLAISGCLFVEQLCIPHLEYCYDGELNVDPLAKLPTPISSSLPDNCREQMTFDGYAMLSAE